MVDFNEFDVLSWLGVVPVLVRQNAVSNANRVAVKCHRQRLFSRDTKWPKAKY